LSFIGEDEIKERAVELKKKRTQKKMFGKGTVIRIWGVLEAEGRQVKYLTGRRENELGETQTEFWQNQEGCSRRRRRLENYPLGVVKLQKEDDDSGLEGYQCCLSGKKETQYPKSFGQVLLWKKPVHGWGGVCWWGGGVS